MTFESYVLNNVLPFFPKFLLTLSKTFQSVFSTMSDLGCVLFFALSPKLLLRVVKLAIDSFNKFNV